MRTAVCAVLRNEIDEVVQWTFHHLNVGFDAVIVYDNESDDGTSALLEHLGDGFPIRLIRWPTNGERPDQNVVYEDCLRRFGSDYDWIAFLDGDEYLVPTERTARIGPFLAGFAAHGAVAINWLIFGSSGRADAAGFLSMEAYTRRSHPDFTANRNVKSIVRPGRVERCHNPHSFALKDGEPTVNLEGKPVPWEHPGVVAEGGIVFGPWRVHHYMVRSLAHWTRRIRGSNPRATPWEAIFEHHDRNEVEDRTAAPWAARVRRQMAENDVWRRTEMFRAVEAQPARGDAGEQEATPRGPAGPSDAPLIDLRIDEVSPGMVRGWAIRPADAARPAVVQVRVDDVPIQEVACTQDRADVAAAGYGTSTVGFSFTLPRSLFDGAAHDLHFRGTEGERVRIITAHGETGFHRFAARWKPTFRSSVDGIHEGVVKGWALREEEDGRWTGGCFVHVTCHGAHVAHVRADRHREDVGRSHAADANCGFEFTAPLAFRKPHPQPFRFVIVPFDVEMTGSPLTTSFISDRNQAALVDLSDSVDRMYVELTRLRRRLRQMLPAPTPNLSTYNEWARSYQEALLARVARRRTTIPSRAHPEPGTPVVSVICPAYRPHLADFTAAVESVMAQTHPGWELLIVDDGSADAALTAQIEAYARRDRRVRAIHLAENAGISEATNAALREATGDWITFLDHDDLLVSVALEVMLEAAHRTGARFLYSDEDKIDSAGYFSEPAFKTDWNYRLLLGCNYICHLVMIDRGTVEAVGLLRGAYNGAQDHDFLLRVCEQVPPDRIHHVPEVLYHWRKSSASTASSAGAKPYAVSAGIAAVSDHLARRGRSADVTSFNGNTWFKVRWRETAAPSVTIIIPYKEQIAVTQRCVDAILSLTSYLNYDVVLVDNWSTSDQALGFGAKMRAHERVTVLRVEEDFNYSRINNLAARRSQSDFYVLMNNDLFVEDEAWLRTLVDEALVDERVGIVGGKFVYPNRMVQHAGVVLGVGGVAAHAHMGIGENDPGYAARALFAQELSAVTAACLLVRSGVYWTVGGLDEEHLTVAFNDVDLCLKVRAAGYKVVWTPEFLAEHHESLSRGDDDVDPVKETRFFHEMQTMIERHGDLLRADPFYSRHFSLEMRPFYDLRSHADREAPDSGGDPAEAVRATYPEGSSVGMTARSTGGERSGA